MQRVVVDTDFNRSWSLTLTDSEVDGGRTDAPAISNGNVTVVRADIRVGYNRVECQEAPELVRHPGLVDPRPVAAAVG